MRGLNIVLSVIYPILIILLLLMNLRSCEREEVRTRIVERVPVVVEPPVEVTDTTAVGRALEVGGSGLLKITLLWDFEGDIDLHVIEPNGVEIYWSYLKDVQTGAQLDVDNTEGGNGSAENVFWDTTPLSGTYKVFLEYFQPSTRTRILGAGECTVVVMKNGIEVETRRVQMSILKERKDITTFAYP